jgi:hypothetical protein
MAKSGENPKPQVFAWSNHPCLLIKSSFRSKFSQFLWPFFMGQPWVAQGHWPLQLLRRVRTGPEGLKRWQGAALVNQMWGWVKLPHMAKLFLYLGE